METVILLLPPVWALCNLIFGTEVVILGSSTRFVSVGNDWVDTSRFLGHLFLHPGHSLMCLAGCIVLNGFS